ncbi:MAG: phosphatase PAP2 family protein [Chloroflexota bacterium]
MIKTHDSSIAAPPQVVIRDQSHPDGFRSPGWFGQHSLMGLILVLLGSGLFSMLAINLQTQGPLLQIDNQIVNNVHQAALHSAPFIIGLMIFGFYLGEHVIVAIGALLVVYFLFKRFWLELGMVLVAWGGEGGIWLLLSQFFNRPRPTFDVSVWRQMTSPGFPSGHSFSAVLCFGFLAYLLLPKIPSLSGRLMVIAAAVLIILFIGFSRIFVGDHYPTDVLAGYGLGVAWGSLVYTALEIIAKRYRHTTRV